LLSKYLIIVINIYGTDESNGIHLTYGEREKKRKRDIKNRDAYKIDVFVFLNES